MRTNLVFSVLVAGLLCAVCYANAPQTQRRHLHQNTLIQGYPCEKGYAWFYGDGKLQRCFVSEDAGFGEIRVPRGSVVNLLTDGRTDYVMLAHPVVIAGLRCAGGGPLGAAEGGMTGLYASGRLRYCFLVADETVQGVPCAAGGFWRSIVGHDLPVEFYEDGKLKSCGLGADFRGKHRFDRVSFPD